MVTYLVIALRLIVPFSILKWPFWGMVLAFGADAIDVILLDIFGHGIFAKFGQQIDKALDIYYLSFAAAVSKNWQERIVGKTAIILFLWRLIGVISFELTRIRQILFFAPNIFENFFLLVTGSKKFFPAFRVDNLKKLTIFFAIAAIPKIIQEYVMHFLQFQTWAFIKHNIFRWK